MCQMLKGSQVRGGAQRVPPRTWSVVGGWGSPLPEVKCGLGFGR